MDSRKRSSLRTLILKQCLKDGADLESPSAGRRSFTLLQSALQSNNNDAAESLMDAGSNVNVGVSSTDNTPNCKDSCHRRHKGVLSAIMLAAGSTACVNLIPDLIRKGATIPKGSRVLVLAIESKASTDTVSYLISSGAHVNELTSTCCVQPRALTPLCAAAKRSNLQAVQLLLSNGANPNSLLVQGNSTYFLSGTGGIPNSPLFIALEYSRHAEDSPADVARLLLEYGANPNISASKLFHLEPSYSEDVYEGERFYYYPIQTAVRLEDIDLVRTLLQHNATPNCKNGTPALVTAVSKFNLRLVRLLLEHNADVNGIGNEPYSQSALEAAVAAKSLELIELFLKAGADINKLSTSRGGRTPLQRAAEIGEIKIIEYLLDHGASMLSQPAPTEGMTVLQGFVENGLHKYISMALEAGVCPNGCSKNGRSPLAAAVIHSDSISLRLLLKAGANIHQYATGKSPDADHEDSWDDNFPLSSTNLSPIQWAAALNDIESARILCEAGANVNQLACRAEGSMALHIAVTYEKLAMVNFLITQNVDLNAYSLSETALSIAIRVISHPIVQKLLREGADPDQLSWSGGISYRPLEIACSQGNVSAVQSLLRAGADVNKGSIFRGFFEDRWPHRDNRWKILEVLLDYGADVNKRDYDEGTALQLTIENEEFDCAYRLLEVGARVNDPPSKGEGGRTALQAAASVGNVDMLEHLISKGADVNAPAAIADGATALQAAAIKGYLRIAQILLEHGADIDAKAGIENGRMAIDGAAEFGRMDMVKFLHDNYQGPRTIAQVCKSAYKAAKKENQWFVMELLETYEQQSQP